MMKFNRRVSHGQQPQPHQPHRRRLFSTGDELLSSPRTMATSKYGRHVLRSRSEERSVRLHESDDVRSVHSSTTAASDRGGGDHVVVVDLDPLSWEPSFAKRRSGGAGVTTPSAMLERLKASTKYHRRSHSDPMDMSGFDDDGVTGEGEDASTATLETTVSSTSTSLANKDGDNSSSSRSNHGAFPTLPRYSAAENTRDLNCWSQPAVDIFKVRGKNYLKDKKKTPSAQYLMQARGCDLLLLSQEAKQEKPLHVLQGSSALLNGTLEAKPTLVVNFRFPWGLLMLHFEFPPSLTPFLQRVPQDQWYRNSLHHAATLLTCPPLSSLSPAERTMAKWIMGDAHYKNQRLKLIPYVVQGPWVVRNLVTGKPAIIGAKLPVSYHYAPEAQTLVAELDIGNSSATAKRIVSICRRYMNALTCDIGLVIQGNSAEELPEQMLGSIRIHGVDPLKAPIFA